MADQGMEPKQAEDLHGDILNCLEVSLNDAESYDRSCDGSACWEK